MTTHIKLVLGAGGFGVPSDKPGRNLDKVTGCQELVDLFLSKGHLEIDTARVYGNGKSEETISQLNTQGALVDTKIFPLGSGDNYSERFRSVFHQSLKALGDKKISIFYLHAPDHSVPYIDTLREVDYLHKQGHFKEFGLSNFASWEVAEIVLIARANGWVEPTVYQGLYNAVERTVEPELFPCLRKFGIRFYAYSPLAGSVFTIDAANTVEDLQKHGGRFDGDSPFSPFLRWKYKPLLPVISQLKETLKKHDIALPAAAYRWLQHHSSLSPEQGDAIIVGASSIQQLKSNLEYSEGGPLPEDIVLILEEAWAQAKSRAHHYANLDLEAAK